MINKHPILSIGIPTFKRPKRLKELLDTLAGQKDLHFDEWEVVVSDNCSLDDTLSVVESYKDKIPRLRYHVNEFNIGADANILKLFDLAQGEYVWLMPDDDLLASERSIRKVIDIIKTSSSLTYLNLNSRMIQFDTNKILLESIYPFQGDIYFSQGRDILSVLSDIDLLAANRLVIKKDSIKPDFSKTYCQGSLLSPLALSLAACSSGSAIVIGEIMTFYREGVILEWRKQWLKLLLQDMPDLLLVACDQLGYSQTTVRKKIEERKTIGFAKMAPHYLIFPRNGISWSKLSRIYGTSYIVSQILLKLFYELPKRIIQKILLALKITSHSK